MSLNLLANYAIDVAEPYLIWGTAAIAGALVLAGLSILLVDYVFTKNGIFKKYIKKAFLAFCAYALVMGIAVLIMEIVKHYDPAYLEENYVSSDITTYVFIPAVITLALTLLSFVGLFFVTKKRPESKKLYSIITGSVCIIAMLVTIVLIAIFYTNNIIGDGYYTDEATGFNSVALYVIAAVLIVGSIIAAFILGRKDKNGFDTRCIAIAGICVALSFALSYVKWDVGLQGGSITLASMLPVMLFAYIYGPKKGILVGFIYGILQAVQDPYIVHPAQFLLDYPIAFSMLGFAGAFNKIRGLERLPQIKFTLGAILAGGLRYLSHLISGVFAFGAYAIDEGFSNFWLYSAIYNSYVFVDVAILLVVGIILLSSKGFNNEINKLTLITENKTEN